MKAYLLIGLTVILFCSCKQSAIKKSFSGADSVVIHFKDEQAGVITRTVQTAETKAINRIVEFMDANETEQFKCGYDGKMFFYDKGKQIQEVDFKMKDPACNHFAFLMNGKITRTKISDEAVDFFVALERGMPYY